LIVATGSIEARDSRVFAIPAPLVQTIAAILRNVNSFEKWMGMATDYDAPRKTDDDSESIEALKERVPDKMSGVVDVDDADNPGGFELPGADLSDIDLDVVVLPPQADEFTCVSCFLVKHRSQIDHETKLGPICVECAA
jgi:hypothetical protein